MYIGKQTTQTEWLLCPCGNSTAHMELCMNNRSSFTSDLGRRHRTCYLFVCTEYFPMLKWILAPFFDLELCVHLEPVKSQLWAGSEIGFHCFASIGVNDDLWRINNECNCIGTSLEWQWNEKSWGIHFSSQIAECFCKTTQTIAT